MNREEINDFCRKLVKKENITFAYTNSEKESIEFNKFQLENYKKKIYSSLFIKVIEKGNIGSQRIEDITKENILKGIKKSKEIARLKKSDVKFKNFGNETCNKKIKFDKRIYKVEMTDVFKELKNNLTKDKYITGYIGGFTKYKINSFTINPYAEKENEKYFLTQTTGVLTKNKKISSGDFSNVYTKLEDINIKNNFNQAKINAYNLLDPGNGEKGEYTIILTPEITSEIIGFILSGTKGDLIEKKTSFLYNQIKKQIFTKELSIIEDPHIDYFLNSEVIDDEGYKTTKKQIINKGVFNKPIYDLYNSIKYKKKPTGNGFSEARYTNKIQLAGKQKIDEIISTTKKGILVYDILGLHTNEINTGDFSLNISSGKMIENGSFTKTITNLNFTGSFKDIFKKAYFSKEQMFFGSSIYSFTIIENVKLI